MVTKLPSDFDILSLFELQEAVVHPDIRHAVGVKRAARLREFVLVVRKHQVDAAAMNVECSPRCFQAIAEHSMCQPGRPCRRDA